MNNTYLTLATMGGVAALFAFGLLSFLVSLHSLIKAVDDPQSVHAAIRSLLSANIQGPADLRLDEEFAEFIRRDKRRILIEEDKRRH
jgi:hypothetical protein